MTDLNAPFQNICIFINQLFNNYSPEDITILKAVLVKLREVVIEARSDGGEKFAVETNE